MSLTTSGVGIGELEGRDRHLGELALVFRHRGGTWGDFGRFLKFLFEDSLPVSSIACRHNSGGKHYETLVASSNQPDEYPMFAHERYSRPCISTGAFEEKKNPGLVVTDLCNKAARFLLSIGKGDAGGTAGRDFDFEPAAVSSPIEPPGESQTTDSQGSIDAGNIVDGPRDLSLAETEEEFDGDDMFDEEDVQELLEQMLAAAPSNSAQLPGPARTISADISEGPSEDSVLQYTGRSTTKMRAATLGYLWGFADRPAELREQFRRLRTDRSLAVLHLCGCGICYKAESGARVPGCVEHSHLRLGSLEENSSHRNFHAMINFARDGDYAQQCAIIHRVDNGHGDGVF